MPIPDRHGRHSNGIRKVELTDDLGRVSTLHLSGEGTLREAMGDIWSATKTDDSRLAIEHWSSIKSITARCGDEIEVFERTPADWMAAQVKDQLQ